MKERDKKRLEIAIKARIRLSRLYIKRCRVSSHALFYPSHVSPPAVYSDRFNTPLTVTDNHTLARHASAYPQSQQSS